MISRIYYTLRIISRIFRCCFHKQKQKCNSVNCDPLNQVYSIVSWNLQGLFCYLHQLKIDNIIKELKLINSDVFCLQEVFEDELKETIIQRLSHTHPYYLHGHTDKKYYLGEDSGLLVLSKYKINFVKEVILPSVIDSDKLANKSILYFQIGDLQLVTTHLQSHNERISQEHLHLMLQESPFTEYIITGDLNHNEAGDILNIPNNNQTRTCETNEILDYILPVNLKHSISNTVLDIDINDVSDHWPIQSIITRYP
jgi:endonuclease/exonuclease/phosphatase family metal-dependent hydrolase